MFSIRQLIALALFALTIVVVGAIAFAANRGGSPKATLFGQTADSYETLSGNFNLYSKITQLNLQEPEARIQMPVKGVKVRQVADTWGAARADNRRHQGQDIFARRGTPVFSAAEGVVLHVGESGLGGKKVFVAGRGGRRYYYAHLDDFAPDLKAGDWVTTNSLLGFVGTTGNARGTPPHLHFGVYTSGGAINPLPLLADRA